jgi:hypothetical protein
VADRMVEVLGAEVVEPEAVDVETLGDYDLVGFGSGIYFMAVHPRLWKLVRRLPRGDGIRVFTFFTSGARELSEKFAGRGPWRRASRSPVAEVNRSMTWTAARSACHSTECGVLTR